MRSGYYTMEGLNRDKAVEIARLTGCRNFVGKIVKFILNAFVDSQYRNLRMGVICVDLGVLDNSASKRVLDLWKSVKSTVWKVVKIAVVKFRMNDGGADCFQQSDTAKFTNIVTLFLVI